MLDRFFLTKSAGMPKKGFLISFVLLFNTFAWYYFTRAIIDEVLRSLGPTDQLTILVPGIYLSTVILSSLVGSDLAGRMNRLHFFYLWVLVGMAASLLPIVLTEYSATNLMTISLLLGFSFGFGMPSCTAYLADCTFFENRGRVSGLVLLLTYMSAPLLLILLGSNVIVVSAFSFVWRAFALGTLFLFKTSNVKTEEKKRVPYMSILRNRAFMLYFIPWLMFCLVDRLERAYLEAFFQPWFFEFFSMLVAPLIGLVFAFIGGLVADQIGRKRVVIYGFIALGVEYALLGLAPSMLVSWYAYAVIDGIAWGVFTVIFVLILWGDLSPTGSYGNKYYAIGGFPFFFAELMGIFARPHVQGIPAESAYATFSLASFFLFLAILPLMYAPETLPERKIELKKQKDYVKQAKKLRHEFLTKKGAKKD